MNVLLLCHRLPYPPNKGDKIRSYNILRYLASKHRVSVGAFVDDPADLQYVPETEKMATGSCKIIPLTFARRWGRMAKAALSGQALSVAAFRSHEMRTWVQRQLSSHVDLVVVFGSAMAPYLLESGWPADRVVFDMVDIDSDKWAQYRENSAWPMSLVYKRESRIVQALERRAAQTFLRTALVSPYETECFSKIVPQSANRLVTSRNGVDLSYYDPHKPYKSPFEAGHVPIVMTGRMDYRPNHEGAEWFAKDVRPRIVQKRADCRFYIVGANPSASLIKSVGPDVRVVGEVPDIRPYLAHAAVSVAPLKIARGVQNKVLEAMAMAKPVVATTVASRALGVQDKRELFIADGADRFSESVLMALDGSFGADMGQRARMFVEKEYSWNDNLSILDRV